VYEVGEQWELHAVVLLSAVVVLVVIAWAEWNRRR
jgi:hypothetical protein